MIALLVDENFNEHIADGLIRRDPTLDLVHVRDVGMAATPDPEILKWAAEAGRILLTHDRNTIPSFAFDRVAADLPMPGVFLVKADMPIGQAIEELHFAAHCLSAQECEGMVHYFPM